MSSSESSEVNDEVSPSPKETTTSSDVSHERSKSNFEGEKPAIIRLSGQGSVESVKELLASIPNATHHTFEGKTALHVASRSGYLQIVELLLSAGADVNCRGYAGKTALHYAVRGNWPKILALLLKSGAHIDAVSHSKRTALHVAVKKSSVECVTVLLENGCDVNVRDKYGDTPLHYALRYPEACMMQIEVRTQFPSSENDRITETLVTAPKVDLSLETQSGQSYLDIAAGHGHTHGVELLTTQAKGLLGHTNAEGWTALHNAALFGHHAICQKLIARAPFLLNRQCTGGFTPMHFAVYQGHCSVIELIVSMGANCNVQDNDKLTSIHLAFELFTLTDETVESGVSCNENGTAIHEILTQLNNIGVKCVFFAIGCYLIRDGHAYVNIKDKFGNSALDILDKISTEHRKKVMNFVLTMVRARNKKESQRKMTRQADQEFLVRIKNLQYKKANEDQYEPRCQNCIDDLKTMAFDKK